MPSDNQPLFKHYFAYRHFQTNGKVQNIIEGMDQVKSPHVCLGLWETSADGLGIEPSMISERQERLIKTVKTLRRSEITCDIALPGPAQLGVSNRMQLNWLQSVAATMSRLGIAAVWIDDRHAIPTVFNRTKLISFYKYYERFIHNENPRQMIGLLAAPAHFYFDFGLTSSDIAKQLSGDKNAMVMVSQTYDNDRDRTGILKTAYELMLHRALNVPSTPVGCVQHDIASPFEKSAAADELQLTLNALFNMDGVLIDCFDRLGTAPGLDNHFLHMQETHRGFMKKIARSGPFNHLGVQIVVPSPEKPVSSRKENPPDLPDHIWPVMLWRMGLPVSMIVAEDIAPKKAPPSVYLLTGRTPQQLSRRQLNEIFTHGVLMDIEAAETIQEMGLPGLIGAKIERAPRKIEREFISDSTFVHPCYGYNTWWAPYYDADDFRLIKPFHNNSRSITTLQAPGRSPTINGIVLFDNIEHSHRSVILPYQLHEGNIKAVMSVHRQRHFRELIAWLLRRRLDCFVEATPDLTPFICRMGTRKRYLLTLMNTGFDWAIDSRIQIAPTLLKIKQVREINEDGKMIDHTKKALRQYRDYQFIELNADTAVAPMQTKTFVVE